MPIVVTTDLPDVGQPSLGNGVEDEIAVDWDDVINYGEYDIQYRETGASTWLDEPSVDEATTSTTITGLEDGEEYEVRMQTQTEHVTGTWTDPVSIVTKFPGATNLSVDAVTETSVDLSWSDNSDNEDGFDVFRAKMYDDGLGPWRLLDTLAPNTTSYTDDTAQPGREYHYYVLAFTEHTDASSSTVSTTTTDSGVRQTNVPTTGWYVEVDHPNPDSPLTPSVLAEDVDYPHAVNDLPRVRIPILKDGFWLEDQQLEGQPMRVWKDGTRLPIGQLENVREQPERVVLEGRGGLALTQRVEAEYVEKAAHLAAGQIIDQTGLAKTVDDPQTTTTNDDRMQSADTTEEWLDRLPSQPSSTDIIAVENGALTTHQTAWFAEVENSSPSGGTEQIETSSDRWSGGRVWEWEVADSTYEVSATFTIDHEIPASNARFAFRMQVPQNGNHGFELLLDGEVLESVGADVLADNETSPDWFVANGTPSSNLQPGDHTVEFAIDGNDGSSADGHIYGDCMALYDDRYDPGLTEQVTDNVITGPDLYPGSIEQEMADATTFLSVVAGKLESSWNDISGDQAVAISNDLGQSWIEATNSETVEGEFAEGKAQIRARFRLSGFDSDADTSPAGRKQPHEVDLYDLYADLDDTPLLINKQYDGQALEALRDIADYGDFIFAVEWDESVDGYSVEWSQPGLRTRESVAALVDYETAKLNEDSYERVLIKGQSRRIEAEEVTADVGTAVSLNQTNLVEGAGRVVSDSDGTVYTEDVNYELSRLPGEITALSDGDISDGELLLVDYDYKITGEYEPPDAPADPKTLVRDVPSIPTSRGCDQAALYLYRVIDEPLIEAEATLDEIPPGASILETITLPDLPTGGEAVELREITQSERSPVIKLGNRQGLGEAIQQIRSQLQAVSKRV